MSVVKVALRTSAGTFLLKNVFVSLRLLVLKVDVT